MPSPSCPCGSTQSYALCCQPLHQQKQFASEPEQLMRSRYCAFVKSEFNYLINTHHPAHLQGLTAAQLAQGPTINWLGLEVISSSKDLTNNLAKVSFKAWYLEHGQLDAIFENSEFIFEQGQWLYSQGQQFTCRQPERNSPCICHSGKKFKHCCMKLIR
ncbi:YchJ family protein [Shewanella sp. SR44-3]|uniref:YchJ family protein n=1 Tax=unclassified Shewanella TaxID=196818 RepID=UPI0015FDEFF5|nr:YchJ family protein [Shewanella sp. SR44-3]MBB1267965.1 YchJ family protein [Shewanella sp. SR44-3]